MSGAGNGAAFLQGLLVQPGDEGDREAGAWAQRACLLCPPCKGWGGGQGSWDQEWGSLDPPSFSPRPGRGCFPLRAKLSPSRPLQLTVGLSPPASRALLCIPALSLSLREHSREVSGLWCLTPGSHLTMILGLVTVLGRSPGVVASRMGVI